MTPPSARRETPELGFVSCDDELREEKVAGEADRTPLTDTETVSMPPGPLGPSIVVVDSVMTSPSSSVFRLCEGDRSHGIGVRRAPPSDSSLPKSVDVGAAQVGLVPLVRAPIWGDGIAAGSG